jgi:hypothetical protein
MTLLTNKNDNTKAIIKIPKKNMQGLRTTKFKKKQKQAGIAHHQIDKAQIALVV